MADLQASSESQISEEVNGVLHVYGSFEMGGAVQNDYSMRSLIVSYPRKFKSNPVLSISVRSNGPSFFTCGVRKMDAEDAAGFKATFGTTEISSYGNNPAQNYTVSWIVVGLV